MTMLAILCGRIKMKREFITLFNEKKYIKDGKEFNKGCENLVKIYYFKHIKMADLKFQQ